MTPAQRAVTRALASAFLSVEWTEPALVAAAASTIDVHSWPRGSERTGPWIAAVIPAVLTAFPRPPHDARDGLAAFIAASEPFQEAWGFRLVSGRIRHWTVDHPRMATPRWPVRRLDTLADVQAWLKLSDGDLGWLSDRRGMEHRTSEPRLQNYRYQWVLKPSGGARLLESPKTRLKGIQRRILEDVLDAIPPHDAAHGFRRGRSALTHAALHRGQAAVLRFDLAAFFAHVPTARAYRVFRAAGYPEEVARTLIGFCTNRAPWSVLGQAPATTDPRLLQARFFEHRRLAAWHLPQGAPTSPALANLCVRSLDLRLSGLAKSLGCTYSRYADDLTFSGDRSLVAHHARIERHVAEIVHDEGYSLNPGKTRAMSASTRQTVTGVVVNQGLGVGRREFDALKATLTNCVRQGPDSQARGRPNLRAHLEGKVAYVESVHPSRGAQLLGLLNRIQWPSDER